MDVSIEAFSDLYQAHAPSVFRYLMYLTGDQSLAEDLMQETFLQAFKTIGSFRGESSLLTWLCAIARNVRAHHARRQRETLPLTDAEALPAETRALHLICEESQQLDQLRAGFRCLEAGQRQVLAMRLGAEMSFREIGEALGKTETWDRVTFYRSRMQLKEKLEA